MKRILAITAIIFVILASFTISSHAAPPQSPVSIVFDGKNAAVRISINNTSYFFLQFNKLYIFQGQSIPNLHTLKGESIKNMNVEKMKGHNDIMGNYTKVTMWKKMDFSRGKFNHHTITISFDFYIAKKTYKKGDFLVNSSIIRYDTKIEGDLKNTHIILEEHMHYNNSKSSNSKVFECTNGEKRWKEMNKTLQAREHRFGQDHKGIIGFGHEKISLKYMWDYQDNIKTFYRYDGSNLFLFFLFNDENGTIIQDPYIYLPVPIINSNPVVQGVQKIINYTIDHAISLGIGLTLAAAVILSAPLIRRIRL